METGEEWSGKFLSGDKAAFDKVIELYREKLIFFLLRYLPVMEDAEDVAEDAFVELLLKKYKPSKKASLKTYLFTVGRNKAFNLLKKQRRRAQEQPEAPDDEEIALEERLVQDEKRQQVSKALNGLSPQYREALHLLYFEELSLEEAAFVMKKNKKQVENLSCRGKKLLRERLSGKEAFL